MIIQKAHKQFNLPVSGLCRRFHIPRASFYRQSIRDDSELLEKIKDIAFNHSAW